MSSVTVSLWDRCKASLAASIPAQPFNTWLRPVVWISSGIEEGVTCVTLGVPDEFHRTWISQHYTDLVETTLAQWTTVRPSVRFVVSDEMPVDRRPAVRAAALQEHALVEACSDPFGSYGSGSGDGSSGSFASSTDSGVPEPVIAVPSRQPARRPSTLNPSYTFDDFIEADCNRLARSAALAVAQRPGATSFNPFLVYGKVGLGKTHLAHAIGNRIADDHPNLRVLYLTSEAFTNAFVHAVQQNMLADFARSFREIDVLIVDDVQFLSGKEKTQEQFFHLFNDLHQGGAQIVLCADRPPAEIVGIEERLLSRFRWGLIADVQPPDLETRIAILQRRASRVGLDLPYDVVEYLAVNVTANIRSLEGALNKLLAAWRIGQIDLTIEKVRPLVADLVETDQRKSLTAGEIRDAVAEAYRLSPDDLMSKSRKRPVVDARHVAMHFCKILTPLSLEAIGKRFGNRDHSTVIHACRAVQARLDTDPLFVEEVEHLAKRLTPVT